MLEEKAGFGGRAAGASVEDTEGFENSVDRGWRYGFKESQDSG